MELKIGRLPSRYTLERNANMKNHLFTIVVGCALTISVFLIRQKAQAQNTSPQTTDKAGATIADAVGAKSNSQESSPIYVTEITFGYRDWKLVSVAHEEGNLNDIAVKAYREGTLQFPEGSII